jgi:hypothetical protein
LVLAKNGAEDDGSDSADQIAVVLEDSSERYSVEKNTEIKEKEEANQLKVVRKLKEIKEKEEAAELAREQEFKDMMMKIIFSTLLFHLLAPLLIRLISYPLKSLLFVLRKVIQVFVFVFMSIFVLKIIFSTLLFYLLAPLIIRLISYPLKSLLFVLRKVIQVFVFVFMSIFGFFRWIGLVDVLKKVSLLVMLILSVPILLIKCLPLFV